MAKEVPKYNGVLQPLWGEPVLRARAMAKQRKQKQKEHRTSGNSSKANDVFNIKKKIPLHIGCNGMFVFTMRMYHRIICPVQLGSVDIWNFHLVIDVVYILRHCMGDYHVRAFPSDLQYLLSNSNNNFNNRRVNDRFHINFWTHRLDLKIMWTK